MLKVYGYKEGCYACTELKVLLTRYNIPYEFFEVEKGNHCFKSVPQVFNPGGTYVGDYNTIRKDIEGDTDDDT